MKRRRNGAFVIPQSVANIGVSNTSPIYALATNTTGLIWGTDEAKIVMNRFKLVAPAGCYLVTLYGRNANNIADANFEICQMVVRPGNWVNVARFNAYGIKVQVASASNAGTLNLLGC